MRGVNGSLPIPIEQRHRSFGSIDDTNKRRFQRNKSLKDGEKPFHMLNQDRCCSCKFPTLKLILVIIICVTVVTIFHCPTEYNEHTSLSGTRPSFVERWIWETPITDPRYISYLDIDWDNISKVLSKVTSRNDRLKIGLLNFNNTENNHWKQLTVNAEYLILHLNHVTNNLTWESLYPEWIDEEEESETPLCPSLPPLKLPSKTQLDVIAVKLPCHKSKNWSRDVARLHLQLASASAKSKYVLFLTDCFPIPNLFTCKELILHSGTAWLYKPDLITMKQKLNLPVGSCELAVPLKSNTLSSSSSKYREAYATILHSANIYVCGAITAAQSIKMAGSTREFIILVDETISAHHREGLSLAGWKVRTIERIRNPKAERDAYNEWNYSKFRLWQLTDYDKIIFIDADLLILRNIDFLFKMPEITAIGNNATLFNSGVMVVEPSNCTFKLLMEHINEIESYNGGDQGYLNEIFTWWHRIPKHMNFLKHFWVGDEEEKKEMKTRLFGAEPPVLYVLHYLGLKPWLCFRDYDCNWNVDILQEFASDVAHRRWWMVHDKMEEGLKKFCLLRSKQKAALEWDRRQAEKANYTDGHWRIKIKDKRLETCFEEFCFWESMLWHWGETNWTDNGTVNAPPVGITSTPNLSSL